MGNILEINLRDKSTSNIALVNKRLLFMLANDKYIQDTFVSDGDTEKIRSFLFVVDQKDALSRDKLKEVEGRDLTHKPGKLILQDIDPELAIRFYVWGLSYESFYTFMDKSGVKKSPFIRFKFDYELAAPSKVVDFIEDDFESKYEEVVIENKRLKMLLNKKGSKVSGPKEIVKSVKSTKPRKERSKPAKIKISK